MPQQTHPDVRRLTSTLARDNTRVRKFLDNLTNRVDDLIDAATHGNWEEVSRISGYISRSSNRRLAPEPSDSPLESGQPTIYPSPLGEEIVDDDYDEYDDFDDGESRSA